MEIYTYRKWILGIGLLLIIGCCLFVVNIPEKGCPPNCPTPTPPPVEIIDQFALQISDLPLEYVFTLARETDGSQPDGLDGCESILQLTADSRPGLHHCYQNEFISNDRSVVVLSAIWVYASNTDDAERAFAFISSQMPVEGVVQNPNFYPVAPLGSESKASAFDLTTPFGEAHGAGYFWRYNETVLRLTVLSRQHISIDLVGLAQRIQFRLETR
jgi:hypothetical protein